ncbi:hypothetical protein ACFQO1_06175 [Jejudonia soesokkakensis]|uniref:Uncharacterized protein n=1 Tax=Jejudonia soesokkakensis TaxID=1323432 RepID=A0ABW2MU16_9FLAO
MDKQNNKLTKPLNRQSEDKKALFIGGVIVFLIAISPLLFYLYESFPETQIWETSLFSYTTSFPDWNSYAWYLTGKIIPLYLLLLWFFTCKHWWYWVLLIPISMFAFQLWGLIVQSNQIDENELAYVLPIMAVVIPGVFLIRAKLFNKVRGNNLREFEEELMIKKSFWQQLRDLFR